MICPKCNVRMVCIESYNEAKEMHTARCYRCKACGKVVHTMETVSDLLTVSSILSKRHKKKKW